MRVQFADSQLQSMRVPKQYPSKIIFNFSRILRLVLLSEMPTENLGPKI